MRWCVVRVMKDGAGLACTTAHTWGGHPARQQPLLLFAAGKSNV